MLFKDKNLQNELEQNGYVVIPFLSKEKLNELNTFYRTVHKGHEPPTFIENIHMTTWCEDAAYKKAVSEGLSEIFKEETARYFDKYRRLNNVFIIKKSGPQTTFKVHQDWNVVDENTYQSVNVWVPLHDVDEKSGALWVLKGSHSINRKIRGAGYLFPDYANFYSDLEKKSLSVKLKAGEAIVFFHSIIHGSPPNFRGENRVAACFTVIPEKAPLCIYFQKKETDKLEKHEPDDDFMFAYKHLRTEAALNPPTNHPVLLPPYHNKKVSIDELNFFLKPKRKLFSRLFSYQS